MYKFIVKTVDGTVHTFDWETIDFFCKDGIVVVYNSKLEEDNLLLWVLKENIIYMKRES